MVVDALSRVGHMYALQVVSSVQPLWIQEVTNSYVTDPQAQEILAILALGFSLHQGVIRFQDRIWIGKNAALQTKIITAMHSSAVGGGALRAAGNLSSPEKNVLLEGNEARCGGIHETVCDLSASQALEYSSCWTIAATAST